MLREETIRIIEEKKVIAIVRGLYGEEILRLAQALHEGGVDVLEATFDPMDAADQVVVIFAGGEGFTDDIPVEEISRFQTELLADLHRSVPGVFDAINTGKKLPEEKLTELRQAIETFRKSF